MAAPNYGDSINVAVAGPTPSKKRKLNQPDHETPPKPTGIFGLATAAITGLFESGRSFNPTNGLTDQDHSNIVASPRTTSIDDPTNTPINPDMTVTGAPVPPKASSVGRPAIKLKALKGTKWDNGQLPATKKPPSKTKPATRGRPPGKSRASLSKPRGRKRTSTQEDPDGVQTSEELPGPATPSKKNKRTRSGSPEDDQDMYGSLGSDDELTAPALDQIALSVSKLGSNRRVTTASMPKGILTPTKNRGLKPQRSVTFSEKTSRGMFFEDFKKNTPGKSAKALKKLRIDKAKEEIDEIACAICSNPRSKPPNEIILCDNCDFAVHQECYDVKEIPAGEWLCKSCAQDDVLQKLSNPSNISIASTATTLSAIPEDAPGIPHLDHHLRSLQRVLLDRCAGRRRIRMFEQQGPYEKTRQLVEQTIVSGEGNSMLLIGPRGSGKTTLINSVVEGLTAEHGQDFHVVRLNGFIHTDDKLALKEIWRQLGREMEVEEDLVNRTNYADTMASLLALLSHPSDIIGTDEGVTSQSVVFIIDEFDMFALHPRQTLLYNLFDIAQSRKAPVAILGCTARLDVVEMLEKRVKSRFSHRQVYLSLPRTLSAYWSICRQGLTVDKADAEREGIDSTVEGYEEFTEYWTQKIEHLHIQRSFQDLLQYHYYTTKSASAFFTEWLLPLSSLSVANLELKSPLPAAEFTSLAPPDSRMQLLSSLSDLELALLIAAARLDIVAHTDTVNFAMAYDEYSSLVGKQRVQSATSGMLAAGGGVRVWSHGVAGIAWERLVDLQLLVPTGLGGGKSLGHSGLDGKMWKVDVALEEIPTAVKLNAVLARWCREI